MEYTIRKEDDGYYYFLELEDRELEFKQNVRGLETGDIVAMANGSGGSILIGLEEVRFSDGTTMGRVVGCPLTDELKQNVNNKASSCIPAIKVDFEEQWIGGIPFVEVTIYEGDNKPYCTAGGCYKIRVDGGTCALDPSALLKIILEKESRKFIDRFRKATAQLENTMSIITEKLEELKNSE